MNINNLLSCIDSIKYNNNEDAKIILEAALKKIKLDYGNFNMIITTPEEILTYRKVAKELKSIKDLLLPVSQEFTDYLWSITYGD